MSEKSEDEKDKKEPRFWTDKDTGKRFFRAKDGKICWVHHQCFTCHEKFNTSEEYDAHRKATGHIKCPHYIAMAKCCFTCGEEFHTDVDPETNKIGTSSGSKLIAHGKKTGHVLWGEKTDMESD